MTREKAKTMRVTNGSSRSDKLTPNYMPEWKDSLIDEIFDDFESRTCEWYKDGDGDMGYYYYSKCGMDFSFTDDRDKLTDHSFIHCPKCGGKIDETIK